MSALPPIPSKSTAPALGLRRRQVTAMFEVTKEVLLVIAEYTRSSPLRGIPSGELYARLMPVLELSQYQSIITALTKAGLITQTNHLLSASEAVVEATKQNQSKP